MENSNIAEIISRVVSQLKEDAAAEGSKGSGQTADVSLRMAKRLMERIETEASRMGVNAVIAVANKGGRPVAVHCMDEALIASYDIAVNKAYTCAALKMSTKELKRLSQPGGDLYGIQHTNEGKIVIFGGGIPIIHNGKVIGGLGVSGGSEAQDTALAEYGEKLIKEALDLWQ